MPVFTVPLDYDETVDHSTVPICVSAEGPEECAGCGNIFLRAFANAQQVFERCKVQAGDKVRAFPRAFGCEVEGIERAFEGNL